MGGVGSELELGESKFINFGLLSGCGTVEAAAGTGGAAVGDGCPLELGMIPNARVSLSPPC